MKLIDILREIGDPETPSIAYPYSGPIGTSRDLNYSFETDSGIKYSVGIKKDMKGSDPEDDRRDYDGNLQLSITFGVGDLGSVDTEIEFKDTKNLFRVMATVIQIVQKVLADHKRTAQVQKVLSNHQGTEITRLKIEPTKRYRGDNRRANLYKTYLAKYTKKYYPGAEISEKYGKIIVDLPK